MNCLVIGCGYLGRRVAERWRAAGDTVTALTRGRADELRAAGFVPLIGDVTDPSSLTVLPRVDVVLYAVAPGPGGQQTTHDVQVRGLLNVLSVVPPPEQFLYVSSTGVYGQTNGEEVDEESPAEPTDPTGQAIREAEQLLLERRPDAVILRFAGIYGPGRLPRVQSLLAGEPVPGDPEQWLNLIHVEDGVRAVDAVRRWHWRGVVNVCDGRPGMRRDYFAFLAEKMGAPAPRFGPAAGRRSANRRVLRRRLIDLPLAYPSYREGLSELMRGERR